MSSVVVIAKVGASRDEGQGLSKTKRKAKNVFAKTNNFSPNLENRTSQWLPRVAWW